MKEIIKIYLDNLNNDLIPFWDQMYDAEYGAFYGEYQNEPIKKANKSAVYLTRLLWTNSVLYQRFKDEKFLNYANSIYNFINNFMYDHKNIGIYWLSDYQGNIINNHKHLYAQTFYLYGLSEYYLICKNEKIKHTIDEIINLIDQKLIDFPNNYAEEFNSNWEKEVNKIMEGYKMYPEITTNTLLHLVEGIGNCYKVFKDEKYQEVTKKTLEIIYKYGYNHQTNSLYAFLDYNLNSVIDVVSYGHDIEVSWLLKKIIGTLDLDEEETKKYFNLLTKQGLASLEGFNGKYMLTEKIKGKISTTDINWWVQAETMIGLKYLYQETKDEEYLDKMKKVIKCIKEYLMTDKEWYWSVDSLKKPTNEHNIAECWKANYHNIRSILEFTGGCDG